MNVHACKVIDALGGTAEVARIFKIKMPSVSKWRDTGIPRARIMYIQAAKPGVLKGVDVDAATSRVAPDVVASEEAQA